MPHMKIILLKYNDLILAMSCYLYAPVYEWVMLQVDLTLQRNALYSLKKNVVGVGYI